MQVTRSFIEMEIGNRVRILESRPGAVNIDQRIAVYRQMLAYVEMNRPTTEQFLMKCQIEGGEWVRFHQYLERMREIYG